MNAEPEGDSGLRLWQKFERQVINFLGDLTDSNVSKLEAVFQAKHAVHAPSFQENADQITLLAHTRRAGATWTQTAVDPTADPLNPPPALASEYDKRLDEKMYRLLTKKALATNAMAIVGDCAS